MRKYPAVTLALLLIVVPSLTSAAVTYGRDKLKGTTKTQGDFNLANRFTVEIDGVVVPGVTSIQGVQQALKMILTRPPNHNPERLSIRITKSYAASDLAWWQSVETKKVERKSVSIIYHNDTGVETGRINFAECVPSKWKGPSLKERNTAHAIEKIDLMCASGTASTM